MVLPPMHVQFVVYILPLILKNKGKLCLLEYIMRGYFTIHINANWVVRLYGIYIGSCTILLLLLYSKRACVKISDFLKTYLQDLELLTSINSQMLNQLRFRRQSVAGCAIESSFFFCYTKLHRLAFWTEDSVGDRTLHLSVEFQ